MKDSHALMAWGRGGGGGVAHKGWLATLWYNGCPAHAFGVGSVLISGCVYPGTTSLRPTHHLPVEAPSISQLKRRVPGGGGGGDLIKKQTNANQR